MIRIFVLVIALAMVVLPIGAQDHGEKAKEYVCPMFCKNAVYQQPGNCPVCGMALVERAALKQQANRNVAILLFDGVQIIDYTAPYEILGQEKFNVYTVAAKPGPVTTSMNMSVNPTYTFSNAPEPFILVIPGGNVDPSVNDPQTIDWIKKSTAQATHVLSVCNGAFFLAKAGLLDGLSATTFHHLIDELARVAPRTKIVRDARYVDNGKIITSAGLSSGIDGTLYLVSKISGKEHAEELALHLEYHWQPEVHWARAAMADRYLNNIDLNLPPDSNWTSTRNVGDMDHWEYSGSLKTVRTAAQLLQDISKKFAEAKWQQQPSKEQNVTKWSFSGDSGSRWNARLSVQPQQEQRYSLSLQIQRAS